MKKFAQVVLRRSIFGKDNFIFSIPKSLENRINKGCAVKVPLSSFIKMGIVFDIFEESPLFETKKILQITSSPLLLDWQLKLINKIAHDYHTSLSHILNMFLPTKIFSSDGLAPCKIYLKIKNQFTEKLKLKGKKQKQLIYFLQKTKNKMGEINFLREKLQVSLVTIKSLLDQGILQKVFRDFFVFEEENNNQEQKFPSFILKKEQENAFEKIKIYKKCLLFGSSGSGKSFLLRKLTFDYLQQKKQVLILSPGLITTLELLRQFEKDFPKEIIQPFHFKMNQNERMLAWWKVKSGKAKIIIANKKGLFLPFKNLGFIAIEEEHDSLGFKNMNHPKINFKNIAENLVQIFKSSLILSSATPSIETFYQTQQKKDNLPLAEIKEKFLAKKINIVDMKNEISAKNFLPFSNLLLRKIKENLQKNKKIILFLNRRGFHTTVICRSCGRVQKCNHCNVVLVQHYKNKQEFLLCHQCGKVFYFPEKCHHCNSFQISSFGFGTQKITTLLKQYFPKTKILRIDKDSTVNKNSAKNILDDFLNTKGSILIGTQMAIKGIEHNEIGLISSLLADIDLQIPDFRSSERMFDNIAQLCGRIKRQNQGEILIQTFIPSSNILQYAAKEDFKSFYQQEIINRKKSFFPPFIRILKITISSLSKENSFKKARKIEEKIKKIILKNEKVFVTLPLVPRKNNYFLVNVFVHCFAPQEILTKLKLKKVDIDIDPVNIF